MAKHRKIALAELKPGRLGGVHIFGQRIRFQMNLFKIGGGADGCPAKTR